MQSCRSSSSSQSSTGSKSSTEMQEQLGLWLSLSPPRNNNCSNSTRSFFSMEDNVSGNENANPKALPPTKLASETASVPVANNNPNQVDTILRLGFGPIDKVTPFYEFMPIMNGRERCCFVDAPFGSGVNYTYADNICSHPSPDAFGEIAQVPLNYGTYAGEFGDGDYGAGGFSEATSGAEVALLADPYGALMLI
ncbi:hypothetical protein TanjilG_02838 [Lupinus angustifolius]|uniref:Uncharacterized protein n=1 Tax=Lupinus angustifolius TaxID=3871 RepID=A0A4P1RLD9_LUPAN|nr:hypothetical protein TanjilG_02838 [Lupinus angustifolius]